MDSSKLAVSDNNTPTENQAAGLAGEKDAEDAPEGSNAE